MLNRRAFFFALAAVSAMASATLANAADKVPYTAQAFEAAQKAGKPILVEITASWCPTCKAQRPILSELTAQPRFKDLAIFEVDFDSQKDVVRGFKATMQSTLITFKGTQEMARSTGDTKPGSIKDLLDTTI